MKQIGLFMLIVVFVVGLAACSRRWHYGHAASNGYRFLATFRADRTASGNGRYPTSPSPPSSQKG